MFSRVRWLKHQYFLMLDIAKLRSIQYQDADNRISNPTDLAAKLPSNLILIMSGMVRKRWRAPVSAKTALCESKRLTCFAHCTLTYYALQFRTACDSDHADWFLTLVLTQLSRFACEIGPICVCRAAPHMIRLQCHCIPWTSAFLHLPTAPAPAPARLTRYNLRYYFLRL